MNFWEHNTNRLITSWHSWLWTLLLPNIKLPENTANGYNRTNYKSVKWTQILRSLTWQWHFKCAHFLLCCAHFALIEKMKHCLRSVNCCLAKWDPRAPFCRGETIKTGLVTTLKYNQVYTIKFYCMEMFCKSARARARMKDTLKVKQQTRQIPLYVH